MPETSVRPDLGERFALAYRLSGALGRGAMGEVWKAERTSDGMPLAIKVIRTAELRARFEREYDALRQLAHPHVVSVLDRGDHGDLAWLALEYVEGGTLQQARVRTPRIPPAWSASVAADILEGLSACHARGILHRDVKPANVLLTRNGRAKLADLGLARDEKRTTILTATGAFLGTVLYMPPEVLIDGELWSAAGDVYSATAILFEMLAGSTWIRGETIPDIVASHEAGLPPRTRLTDVPEALVRAVEAGLARRAADRPGAAELMALVQAAVPRPAELEASPAAPAPERLAQVRTVVGARAGPAAVDVTSTVVGKPPAPAQATPFPPDAAQDFRPLRLLGSGATGEVWLAEQIALGRLVAVKLMRSGHYASTEAIVRFMEEARTAARCAHPSIVTIITHGAAAGIPYIVYELIEGPTLRQLLQPGRLPLETALDVATQVAEALAYLHDAQVIHRDVKPENLMECEPGRFKLIDLGIARDPQSTTRTATGAIMGTPAYMAPELVRGLRALPQTDLYALGVMLYEMLTGELPFDSPSPVQLMQLHLTMPIPTPSRLVPGLPAGLDRIVRRLLEKEPRERYGTAAELLAALERTRTVRAAAAPIEPAPQRALVPKPPQPPKPRAPPTPPVAQEEDGKTVKVAILVILQVATAVLTVSETVATALRVIAALAVLGGIGLAVWVIRTWMAGRRE